jgi:hypothetical protein
MRDHRGVVFVAVVSALSLQSSVSEGVETNGRALVEAVRGLVAGFMSAWKRVRRALGYASF